MDKRDRTKLSKGILEMKFMQRSSMVKDLKQDEAELYQQIDDDHWELDIPDFVEKQSPYVVEPSFMRIEELRFGRMSFGGMNPEIEKLMRAQDAEQDLAFAEEREKEMGVDEEEMADRYANLVGTIAKKFSSKRDHSVLEESNDEDLEELETVVPQKKTKKEKKKKPRTFLKPEDN